MQNFFYLPNFSIEASEVQTKQQTSRLSMYFKSSQRLSKMSSAKASRRVLQQVRACKSSARTPSDYFFKFSTVS